MPKKTLTPEEIIERDEYIDGIELLEGKDGVKAIAKHNRHDKQELKELDKVYKRIEKRELKTMKHGVEVDVVEADFINVVRLGRAWTPENLYGIFDGEVNPLDLTLYADRFGSDEDAS